MTILFYTKHNLFCGRQNKITMHTGALTLFQSILLYDVQMVIFLTSASVKEKKSGAKNCIYNYRAGLVADIVQ